MLFLFCRSLVFILLWCVGVVWCGVVWCGVVWCGVVWCGVVWCGVVWCGVVWCGVVWCGVVWCGVVWCGVVWCGVVWCGVVWCGVVWCGVVWCGVVWCGVVWCGVVWCGVVWCGVVWCGVVWCGVVWCGVVWCGVVWCGVVWCGVVWCGVVWCGVVWCGVVWCGVVWCGVVWCGVVWCGVVWCGVVWCGVVWCGVVWCGVVWCGVVWCGVVWCGVVWCGVVWCGVVWCGVVWCGVVWCGVVWCGVVWCGVVWCGVVWCGVVWCGVVWCGVVWCGVVWCGVVWCGVVWCGVVWCGVVWCGVVWCGVVWCGVVWCGVVWCGVVWCGVVWCGVVWCGVVWCGVVWCGVVWCGVVWCGVVWCGVVWCGVVWCGVVWCGVVWCGVVWCGVVWCGVAKEEADRDAQKNLKRLQAKLKDATLKDEDLRWRLEAAKAGVGSMGSRFGSSLLLGTPVDPGGPNRPMALFPPPIPLQNVVESYDVTTEPVLGHRMNVALNSFFPGLEEGTMTAEIGAYKHNHSSMFTQWKTKNPATPMVGTQIQVHASEAQIRDIFAMGACHVFHAKVTGLSPLKILVDDKTLILSDNKKQSPVWFVEQFAGSYGGWSFGLDYISQFLEDAEKPKVLAIEAHLPHVVNFALSHRYQMVGSPEDLPVSFLQDHPFSTIIHSPIQDLRWQRLLQDLHTVAWCISAPCPSWSFAGSQEGFFAQDGLSLGEAVGQAKVHKPDYLLLEQVSGFPQHDHFDMFCRLLAWAGYRLLHHQCYELDSVCPVKRSRWIAVCHHESISPPYVPIARWPKLMTTPQHFDAILCLSDMELKQYEPTQAVAAMYWNPDYMPGKKMKWTRQDIIKFRLPSLEQALPTFMAAYGSQHGLPTKVLLERGMFGHFVRQKNTFRFFSPAEVLMLHSHATTTLILKPLKHGYQALGNCITVPHALFALFHLFKALDQLPLELTFTALLVRFLSERLKASKVVVLQDNCAWYVGHPQECQNLKLHLQYYMAQLQWKVEDSNREWPAKKFFHPVKGLISFELEATALEPTQKFQVHFSVMPCFLPGEYGHLKVDGQTSWDTLLSLWHHAVEPQNFLGDFHRRDSAIDATCPDAHIVLQQVTPPACPLATDAFAMLLRTQEDLSLYEVHQGETWADVCTRCMLPDQRYYDVLGKRTSQQVVSPFFEVTTFPDDTSTIPQFGQIFDSIRTCTWTTWELFFRILRMATDSLLTAEGLTWMLSFQNRICCKGNARLGETIVVLDLIRFLGQLFEDVSPALYEHDQPLSESPVGTASERSFSLGMIPHDVPMPPIAECSTFPIDPLDLVTNLTWDVVVSPETNELHVQYRGDALALDQITQMWKHVQAEETCRNEGFMLCIDPVSDLEPTTVRFHIRPLHDTAHVQQVQTALFRQLLSGFLQCPPAVTGLSVIFTYRHQTLVHQMVNPDLSKRTIDVILRHLYRLLNQQGAPRIMLGGLIVEANFTLGEYAMEHEVKQIMINVADPVALRLTGGGPPKPPTNKQDFAKLVESNLANMLLEYDFHLPQIPSTVTKVLDKFGMSHVHQLLTQQNPSKKHEQFRELCRQADIKLPSGGPRRSMVQGTYTKLQERKQLKAALAVDPGHYQLKVGFFRNTDGTAANLLTQFSPHANGILMTNTQTAQEWANVFTTLATDELALYVLGSPPNCALQMSTVGAPAIHQESGKEVLLNGVLVQFGTKHILTSAASLGEVRVNDTQVASITVWKSDVESSLWQQIQTAPVKTIMDLLDRDGGPGLLRKAWGRVWQRDGVNVSPEQATSLQFHGEFDKSSRFAALLKRSGFSHVFIQPKGPNGKPADAWRVIWLPGTALEIETKTAALGGTAGLVKSKKGLGIRLEKGAFSQAWRILKPDTPEPDANNPAIVCRLYPLPHGVDSEILKTWAASQFNWHIKPLKSTGAKQWIIACDVLPEGFLTFNGQPLLLQRLPQKGANNPGLVLAGPKAALPSMNTTDPAKRSPVGDLLSDPWAPAAAERRAAVNRQVEGPVASMFQQQDTRIQTLEQAVHKLQTSQQETSTAIQERQQVLEGHFQAHVQQTQHNFDRVQSEQHAIQTTIAQAMHKQEERLVSAFEELKVLFAGRGTKRQQGSDEDGEMMDPAQTLLNWNE
eukprot:Skav220302  [mRNA]  locus=scaffold3050:48201:61061:- [translate_table: standard]